MSYNPNKAIHPGYTLAKVLEREGMTQKKLSERTGLTEKHISQIVNGEVSVTVETALLLENVFGGTASFWINLEKNYQEISARLERLSLVEKEIGLISEFPYSELVKRGYIEQTGNRSKKVENLWRFFGVNSLLAVANTDPVAYRKRNDIKIKNGYISAWLRCGEIETKKNILPEYSESKLRELLPVLKTLSIKQPPEFSTKLVEKLNEAGVGLVYVPHFHGTGVSGAVRWIGNNPLIQLSIYYACADIFWFNLYHEIGHLILHGKKESFIEFDKKEMSVVQTKEEEANNFAREELIPSKNYSEFIKNSLTRQGVIDFANSLNIHPCIVAGRLGHENKVGWKNLSSLRPRLKFS